MGHSLSAATRPPFIGNLCRSVPNDESQNSKYAFALAVLDYFVTQITIHA